MDLFEEAITQCEREMDLLWEIHEEIRKNRDALVEMKRLVKRNENSCYHHCADDLKKILKERQVTLSREVEGKEPPECGKTHDCWKAKVKRNGIYVDGNWVNSIDLSKYMGTWLIVQKNEHGIDLFTLKERYLFSIDIPTSHELDWSEAIRRMQINQKG